MDPGVQFSRTSDGANIAYWSMGGGFPIVAMPSMPWSHLQLEWSIPEVAAWYQDLGRGRRLIRYDGRGFGLSQRQVPSQSLEAQILDLEAVVEQTGIERFDIYAGLHSGPPAIAYAARFPDRVAHLILFCCYADGLAYGSSPLAQATRPIISQDWEFYTEMVARLLLGWSEPEAAHRFAHLVKECTTPEVAMEALTATAGFDVTDILAQVRVPTLVLHRRELRIASMDAARVLAAGIPGAHLVLLEGTSVAPYLGDVGAVTSEIDAFLSDADSGVRRSGRMATGALQTIFFTDVEGSTTLTQRLGDVAARQVLREHEKIVRDELRRFHGEEIKAMGDGFMASFGSAVSAVQCAVALQRSLTNHNVTADEPIRIRVGINAGEPIAEDDDLFGTAVITAARIGTHAAAGEILVSDVVRQLVSGKGFRFIDRGTVTLRGFAEPTHLHEVEWEAGPAATS